MADVFADAPLAGQELSTVVYFQQTMMATHLEDGGLWVAVDGHNNLAVFHASNMLDGTTDAHCNIQLRCNHLACLANLGSKPDKLI
jgi:hypothetical protein